MPSVPAAPDRHVAVIEGATVRLLRLALSFGLVNVLLGLVFALVDGRGVGVIALAALWTGAWALAVVHADVACRLLRERGWGVSAATCAASTATLALTGGASSPVRTEGNWLGWAMTVVASPVVAVTVGALLCGSLLAGMLLAGTSLHDVVLGPDRYTIVTDLLNPLVGTLVGLALAGVFRSVLVGAGRDLWRIRSGDLVVTPGLAALLAGRPILALPAPRPDPDPLTPAQRAIVTMLCDGHTPQEIALLTGRKPDTIYEHLKNARKRVGARTLDHLVAKTWRPPT